MHLRLRSRLHSNFSDYCPKRTHHPEAKQTKGHSANKTQARQHKILIVIFKRHQAHSQLAPPPPCPLYSILPTYTSFLGLGYSCDQQKGGDLTPKNKHYNKSLPTGRWQLFFRKTKGTKQRSITDNIFSFLHLKCCTLRASFHKSEATLREGSKWTGAFFWMFKTAPWLGDKKQTATHIYVWAFETPLNCSATK